ncbi:MAG: hypothetical protein V7739_19855 [Motiliproteus sp.]
MSGERFDPKDKCPVISSSPAWADCKVRSACVAVRVQVESADLVLVLIVIVTSSIFIVVAQVEYAYWVCVRTG